MVVDIRAPRWSFNCLFQESLQLKVLVNDEDGVSDNDFVSYHRIDINSTEIALTRVTGGQDFSVADEITRYCFARWYHFVGIVSGLVILKLI